MELVYQKLLTQFSNAFDRNCSTKPIFIPHDFQLSINVNKKWYEWKLCSNLYKYGHKNTLICTFMFYFRLPETLHVIDGTLTHI